MKMKLTSLLIAAGATLAHAAHLRIASAPSTLVPSPATQISHTTNAYLTKNGHTYAAPLSAGGEFDFRNVTKGSYLVDVVAKEYVFAPLRLDVLDTDAGEEVRAWGTWRGNEWSNTAEGVEVVQDKGVSRIGVLVAGRKEVFVERVGCAYFPFPSPSKTSSIEETKRAIANEGRVVSVMSVLKNPMILMAGAARLMMFGMPYLVDNMDDETRAEFEERQKSGPMAKIMGAGGTGADGKGVADFDAAGWLAEKTKGKGRSA